MKKLNQIGLAVASLLSFSIFNTACTDKAGELVPAEEAKGGYVLAIRSEGDADVSTDYLVTVDDLMNGEISIVGNGIEQSGYHFYQQTGKYLTTVTYTDANVATVYTLDQKNELSEHGQFSIGRLHLFQSINDHTFISMNIPRGGSENATFYVVDTEAADIVKEKAVSVFAPTQGSGEQAYFSGMTLRGNKLFVPFFQIASSAFDSQYTDSAYVAIYSYPELEFEKVIRDERTGPIGAYAGEGYIFETENGDIYGASSTAISSGFPQETKPSGILRINSGETEFDEDYFFNIEEATGGYKLCAIHYLENNKALASIYSFKEHKPEDKWSRRDVKLAMLDLSTKTLEYIEDIPLHYGGPTAGFPRILFEENGKVYVKINSAEGIYVYEVDPATLTAKRGAKINGAAVYGFFNLNP